MKQIRRGTDGLDVAVSLEKRGVSDRSHSVQQNRALTERVAPAHLSRGPRAFESRYLSAWIACVTSLGVVQKNYSAAILSSIACAQGTILFPVHQGLEREREECEDK